MLHRLLFEANRYKKKKVLKFHTSALICAGTLANSGLDANVVRFSTASIRGPVATRHLCLFSSEKSPSKACAVRRREEILTQLEQRKECILRINLPFCKYYTSIIKVKPEQSRRRSQSFSV